MVIVVRSCILAGLILGMGLGAAAQDADSKAGQDKVVFEKGKAAFPYEGEIKADRLNVRLFLGTDKDGIVVSVLGQGARVIAVGERGDFLQILPPKGCHVWISATKVKKNSDTEGTVLTNDTPVRLDSRHNAEKLAGLNEGDKVAIVKEHMGWFQIQAPDSVKYFVARKYVEFVGEAKVETKADPKKVEAEAKKGGDDAARTFLREADAMFDEVLKKLAADPKNIEDTYVSAIELYVRASEVAVSADLKKFADQKAQDARKIEAARQFAVDKIRTIKQPEPAPVSAPKFEFTGYVDTVGALWNRPGTHKLIMADRIVCFIKCSDETMRIKMNGMFQKYVGIKGKVTRDPEGWTGYAVVEVESVEELINK
jgi:hypothetical protein